MRWQRIVSLGIVAGGLAAGLHALTPVARAADELPRIAVLNLDTRDAAEEAEGVAEELRAVFVKSGQYTVVDRTLTGRIMKEWETQQSGLTDQDRAVKVGKLYNVQYIVSGKLSKFPGGGWQVSGVMLDAQTGIALRAETVRHRGDFFSLLDQQVPALGRALLGRGPSETTGARTVAAASAPMAIPIPGGPDLTGDWRSAAPLRTAVQDHAAVGMGNKVYVVGGQTPAGASGAVYVYDAGSNTWSTQGSAVPTLRRYPSAVAVDGRIFVIGGMIDNKPSNAVEAFDPATGLWQKLAPLPTPRWQAGAAEVAGKIYVIGGRTGKNDLSDAVEAFDVRANTWASRGKAPLKRAAAAAVSMGGVIYVIGGETKDVGVSFLSVKSGEEITAEYEPIGDRWAAKASAPVGRFGPSAVAVGRKIYVFGGLVGSSLMRSPARHYDVYDQGADRWLANQPMPRGRANHAAALAGNKIYVIGGSGDPGTLVDELR